MRRHFSFTKKRESTVRQIVFPAAAFTLLLSAILLTVGSLSGAADEAGLRSAQQAVARAAVQCYALEGFYPPDIQYLQEHYGLAVDTRRYWVDYQVTASNLMPDIMVTPRGGEGWR